MTTETFYNRGIWSISMRILTLPLLCIVLAAPAFAQERDDDWDPMTVDIVDALNCHIDAQSYNGFAITLDDSDQNWKKRGWKKLQSPNFMMSEYRLPAPIEVTAGYKTDRIAFTSSGVLAILDLADPGVIAKDEQIENQMDPNPMIDAIVKSGVASRAEVEKEMTFRKFLGERVIVDESETDEKLGMVFHTKIARSISNVTSHPGKTLYGCSYRIDMKEIGAQ
jgi:hypothetical protein